MLSMRSLSRDSDCCVTLQGEGQPGLALKGVLASSAAEGCVEGSTRLAGPCLNDVCVPVISRVCPKSAARSAPPFASVSQRQHPQQSAGIRTRMRDGERELVGAPCGRRWVV